MILTYHHNINISPRVADACAGTSFKKCAMPWEGADGLLRIHSTMDDHYLEDLDLTDLRSLRALEILELGQADHAI